MLSTDLENAASDAGEGIWRMPMHSSYRKGLKSLLADMKNTGPRPGGSITAALFLRRFAGDTNYAHFDIYGWQPTAAPARPKGGVGMGARAILEALPELLAL